MRIEGLKVRSALLCIVTAACFHAGAHGKNLGTIGPTYGIAETNLLAMIEQRLLAKKESGELRRLEEEAKRQAVLSVQSPKPIPGLKRADTARTFYFDPTYTLDRNVFDGSGRLLFPVGTKKNPLEIVSLSKHLLFFDARDEQQIARARQLIDVYRGKVKPILVAGSYLAVMKRWQLPVYYDQGGILTKRLGINKVPAIVSQDGLRLRIDELVL